MVSSGECVKVVELAALLVGVAEEIPLLASWLGSRVGGVEVVGLGEPNTEGLVVSSGECVKVVELAALLLGVAEEIPLAGKGAGTEGFSCGFRGAIGVLIS